MKKFTKLFILVVMVTLLAGCGKVATLKNGEQLVAKTNDEKITSNELYDALIEKYGAEKFVEILDTAIFNKMYIRSTNSKFFNNLFYFFIFHRTNSTASITNA